MNWFTVIDVVPVLSWADRLCWKWTDPQSVVLLLYRLGLIDYVESELIYSHWCCSNTVLSWSTMLKVNWSAVSWVIPIPSWADRLCWKWTDPQSVVLFQYHLGLIWCTMVLPWLTADRTAGPERSNRESKPWRADCVWECTGGVSLWCGHCHASASKTQPGQVIIYIYIA